MPVPCTFYFFIYIFGGIEDYKVTCVVHALSLYNRHPQQFKYEGFIIHNSYKEYKKG